MPEHYFSWLEESGVREALQALYTPPIGIVGNDGVARLPVRDRHRLPLS